MGRTCDHLVAPPIVGYDQYHLNHATVLTERICGHGAGQDGHQFGISMALCLDYYDSYHDVSLVFHDSRGLVNALQPSFQVDCLRRFSRAFHRGQTPLYKGDTEATRLRLWELLVHLASDDHPLCSVGSLFFCAYLGHSIWRIISTGVSSFYSRILSDFALAVEFCLGLWISNRPYIGSNSNLRNKAASVVHTAM
jgi:hypothetical protein